jgi:hypothetical protein
VPTFADNQDDIDETKYQNDINVKVFLSELARFNKKMLKIADDATKIHGVILLQCSTALKIRLRRSTEGAAAESGNCPRELIRCLQVALCTNNHNDPLETMEMAKALLAQMHHAGPHEVLGGMKKRVVAQMRTLTAVVDIFTVSEIDRLALFELAADTAAQAAAKLVQRDTLRVNHVMKHIIARPLTAELLSTESEDQPRLRHD